MNKHTIVAGEVGTEKTTSQAELRSLLASGHAGRTAGVTITDAPELMTGSFWSKQADALRARLAGEGPEFAAVASLAQIEALAGPEFLTQSEAARHAIIAVMRSVSETDEGDTR